MSHAVPRPHRSRRAARAAAGLALAATSALAVATTAPTTADAAPARHSTRAARGLDLGTGSLPETRTVQNIARGVTLTTIVRGQRQATSRTIASTDAGPWRIRLVTIDPRRARGSLRTAIGADIARTDRVSTLAKGTRATVAVNGSYFSQGRRVGPGDMVGLAVYEGSVISQPQRVAGHIGVLFDSRTKALRMGDFTWRASVGSADGTLPVDAVDTPPLVPAGCEQTTAEPGCAAPGQVVRFTSHWAARTPSGAGAEVVLDRRGCVVTAAAVRGAALAEGQTSLQATGRLADRLLSVAGTGCPESNESLTDTDGDRVPLRSTTFGVTGRYRLVEDGQVVAPAYAGSFFSRHPRTVIGRTAGGSVMLMTIDGRSTASVGATLVEAGRAARSLGMVDAANLDGGGSTAMAVNGRLVNAPSEKKERAVGDAVLLMP